MTKIDPIQLAKHIELFATDLSHAIYMEDRKQAVIYLSNRVGTVMANKIAEVFGLTSKYYID
jgi:hypothetical protein